MLTDYTLTEDADDRGTVLAHRPDCRMVVLHRMRGRPICTMFGCEGPLPPDVKKHSCLQAWRGRKRERAA